MKKYLAEFIGTMVLVLIGCGTAMTVGCDAMLGGGYVLTAFAFGLGLLTMAYSIGNVSGCHINPAVSIAMLVSGKMDLKDFAGYVISQFLGALAGAAVLMAIVLALSACGSDVAQADYDKITAESAQLRLSSGLVLIVMTDR